jgi:hypothetical protein
VEAAESGDDLSPKSHASWGSTDPQHVPESRLIISVKIAPRQLQWFPSWSTDTPPVYKKLTICEDSDPNHKLAECIQELDTDNEVCDFWVLARLFA